MTPNGPKINIKTGIRKKCCICNWRNFVFCIILTAILLQIVGINKSKDPSQGT